MKMMIPNLILKGALVSSIMLTVNLTDEKTEFLQRRKGALM